MKSVSGRHSAEEDVDCQAGGDLHVSAPMSRRQTKSILRRKAPEALTKSVTWKEDEMQPNP